MRITIDIDTDRPEAFDTLRADLAGLLGHTDEHGPAATWVQIRETEYEGTAVRREWIGESETLPETFERLRAEMGEATGSLTMPTDRPEPWRPTMSTKTRVIDLIEDIVTAADMPLTRGDINALATAALGDYPVTGVVRLLDPELRLGSTLSTMRATRIVRVVQAATPATVAALVNYNA
jgi:hypothetical protein